MAKIIVYSAPWCPWCKKTKQFLDEHKVKYEERDVDSNPKFHEELFKKSGQMGIPVTDIDGQIIIGFDEKELRRVLKIK